MGDNGHRGRLFPADSDQQLDLTIIPFGAQTWADPHAPDAFSAGTVPGLCIYSCIGYGPGHAAGEDQRLGKGPADERGLCLPFAGCAVSSERLPAGVARVPELVLWRGYLVFREFTGSAIPL